MKLKDETLWNQAVENNKSAYGRAVITYAQRWAELMELQLAKGTTIFECAEVTFSEANTEGITGFMLGSVIAILSHVWEHGEELRKWYNKKLAIVISGK